MHQNIQVDDIDVQAEGPPSAPAIVMIHGWPDTLEVWGGQVESLSMDYRCVRFTLPGYRVNDTRRAYSLEEVVLAIGAVVDAVSPDAPVVLMLHDWGCVYGYAYSVVAPDRVSAVVMLDIGDANSPALEAELTGKAKIMRASYQGALAFAWRRGGRLGDRITRTLAKAMAPHTDPSQVHAGMNYPYQVVRDGTDDAIVGEHITHPTFFLYGTQKPFMFHSSEWAASLTAKDHCQVVAVDAGHWLMLDQATEVSTRILSWLSFIPDPPPSDHAPAAALSNDSQEMNR